MKKLFINGNRAGYSPEQCGKTLTVIELKNILGDLVKNGCVSNDTEIFIVNDNGYTFEHIDKMSFGENYDDAENIEDYI